MNKVKIDIDNSTLIKMMSDFAFYGDEEVYLRELLQNAMDACMTKRAYEWSWGTEFLELNEARMINSMRRFFEPRISISYSSLTQRLTVEDNGIGINDRDIELYVSKIGKSYYTSSEYELQHLQYEPVGHFGIGLLSCFNVSRALLIESKKDGCVNTAWNVEEQQSLEPVTAKWFEGAEEMEYIYSNREEPGTKVTLVLKPKYAMRLSMQGIVKLVRKYMLYQPFPIEVSFDERKAVVQERNTMLDNPFTDVLGIVAIPLADELMEGYVWLYPTKYQGMFGTSCLYQQGFWIGNDICLRPEWIRDMTYHIHIKKRFLTLRASRDGVANDGYLKDLRGLIGQKIVAHFKNNPIGLNQYLNRGSQPLLSEYKEEIELLGKAVIVDVFLKGREISLPIATIIHGFRGKVIRIAFITRKLFDYYSKNYFADFRHFLKENKLIVFDSNRDIFCQFLAPYMRSHRYVVSELPGVIYEEMIADFHMEKSAAFYRNAFGLKPPDLGYDELFCIVTNRKQEIFELLVNEEHRLYKLIAPVLYEPKIHNVLQVILENIKQRIINAPHSWDKMVDFGGAFVDDWNQELVPSIQAIGCLEPDFAISVNEFIHSRISTREIMKYGLEDFEFRKEDFVTWFCSDK